jgi:hypothetical protein
MILSFGWTSQYLPPNGCKDTTRRIWSGRTVEPVVIRFKFTPLILPKPKQLSLLEIA